MPSTLTDEMEQNADWYKNEFNETKRNETTHDKRFLSRLFWHHRNNEKKKD